MANSFDLTVAVGQQTDKLAITKITISGYDTAEPTAVVEYDEFETDGITFIRSTRATIADGAAFKTLLDVSGTFDVYAELKSILHAQLFAEGVHGAGVDV